MSAVIALAFEIIRRLIDRALSAGQAPIHPSDLPDLPDWETPAVFHTKPSLEHTANVALRAADDGDATDALCELTRLTGLGCPDKAMFLANCIRTAWHVHPKVALAAVRAAQSARVA
jgi:hypothetical protein